MKYAESIATAVTDFLLARDVVYAFDRENGYIMTDFGMEGEDNPLEMIISLQEDTFVCYCVLPNDIPMALFPAVGEYLHRANFGLLNGNFELDYDEGAVQYKTLGFCPDGTVSEELLEAVLMAPMAILRRYHPGLKELLQHPKADIALLVAKMEQ